MQILAPVLATLSLLTAAAAIPIDLEDQVRDIVTPLRSNGWTAYSEWISYTSRESISTPAAIVSWQYKLDWATDNFQVISLLSSFPTSAWSSYAAEAYPTSLFPDRSLIDRMPQEFANKAARASRALVLPVLASISRDAALMRKWNSYLYTATARIPSQATSWLTGIATAREREANSLFANIPTAAFKSYIDAVYPSEVFSNNEGIYSQLLNYYSTEAVRYFSTAGTLDSSPDASARETGSSESSSSRSSSSSTTTAAERSAGTVQMSASFMLVFFSALACLIFV